MNAYFPRSFAYYIIKLFNQNIPQKLCGETEYKDIRKSLTRGASFFSPNGKAERGNRDFPHHSMANSRITNEEPPFKKEGDPEWRCLRLDRLVELAPSDP